MSADRIPSLLARLIGHHPAALRTVRWSVEPLGPQALAHLELETKHGQVVVIDHRSGAVYARPPAPPGIHPPRQQRDLSAEVALAFTDRPVIEAIEPLTEAGKLRGWRFRFSTGRAFGLTLDDRVPLLSLDNHRPSNIAMIRYEVGAASDYPQILELNEEAIPAVNRIDRRELETLHTQARVLIAARTGGRLAGFLLALDESARYDSLNFQYFKRHYPQFVYVDRIVVDPEFRGQGVGRGLYGSLFEAVSGASRVTCEVNVEPPNPGSLAFHAELGFQIIDHQDTEGGRKRVALMVRSTPEPT